MLISASKQTDTKYIEVNIMAEEHDNKNKNNTNILGVKAAGESSTAGVGQYLKDVVAFVVEQGLGKTRSAILIKQLTSYGGCSAKQLDGRTTHILVGNSTKLEKLPKILKINENELHEDVEIVRADWLSGCLKEGKLIELAPFRLRKKQNEMVEGKREQEFFCLKTDEQSFCGLEDKTKSQKDLDRPGTAETENVKACRKRKLEMSGNPNGYNNGYESDYKDSGDEDNEEMSCEENEMDQASEIAPHISPHKKDDSWVCTKPSSSRENNFNEHITEKLEVLEKVYKNTNDRWRALGYRKAISSIKNHHKKIETFEECRSLPFVGERLAKKIWEIIETGKLERLEHLDEKTEAIDLFCNVWGAGPKSAENWVAKGLKTLEDLKEHGNLNRQQIIGLKYYEEFLERMPRSEAEKIGQVVSDAARFIDPGLQCLVCGSFRRGRSTCGDVDVLVSHPDGISHEGVMARLLEHLHETGFLTDDLTLMDNKNQRKYLGVCQLPGESAKHRRIDIIVVPYAEWPCALVYFTGSDYLNRSMRLLARKKGMSLSEHSLNTGVVRKGQERIADGTPLPVSNEKDIFQYLGLDYLEPCDRDW